MTQIALIALFQVVVAASALPAVDSQAELKVMVSWGHTSRETTSFHIQLLTNEVAIVNIRGLGLETDDSVKDGIFETHAGNGDIDGVELTLRYAPRQVNTIKNLHRIWADLIAQSDLDTASRLKQDPAYRLDSRKLTVQMDVAGTKGFSVTVNQLLQKKTFWVSSLDVYLAVGDIPPSFSDHQKQLESYIGKCILDQIAMMPRQLTTNTSHAGKIWAVQYICILPSLHLATSLV